MMQKFVIIVSTFALVAACSPSGGSSEIAAQPDDLKPKAEIELAAVKDTTVHTEEKIVNSPAVPAKTEEDEKMDCIFEQETQTDEFVKAVPEFANYTWNDTTKTATIQLPNGEILIAKRGGCNHFGISGQWIQKGRDHKLGELEYWLEQGKWISKRIMPPADYETYVSMVENKAYEVGLHDTSLYILFQHPDYAEWSLFVEYGPEKANPTTTVENSYYIN